MQLRENGLANIFFNKETGGFQRNLCPLAFAESEFGNPIAKYIFLLFLLHYWN